jgi:hypothetical protein
MEQELLGSSMTVALISLSFMLMRRMAGIILVKGDEG